jgi:HEAT repeat protein
MFLLVAGCKSASSPSKGPTGGDGATPSGPKTSGTAPTNPSDGGPKADPEMEKAFKMLMDDTDDATSYNGAVKLAASGAAAAPYFAKALKEGKEPVKLNVLSTLAKAPDWAKGAGKDLAPAVSAALKDESSFKVRREATKVVVALRYPEAITALRTAVTTEQDTGTKREMEKALQELK